MKKKSIILIILVLLLLITIFIFFNKNKEEKALLIINKGKVELYHNNNWVLAKNNTYLKKNDKIRTLDGKATIIFNNLITELEPNTTIIIKNITNPYLKQEGKTWNKIISLFSNKKVTLESKEIKAMVVGTAFMLTNKKLIVAEGEVKVKNKDKEFEVKNNFVLENNTIRKLNKEEKKEIKEKMNKTLKELIKERNKLIIKNKGIIKLLLKNKNIKSNKELIKLINNKLNILNEDELIILYNNIKNKPISTDLKRIILLSYEITRMKNSINIIS